LANAIYFTSGIGVYDAGFIFGDSLATELVREATRNPLEFVSPLGMSGAELLKEKRDVFIAWWDSRTPENSAEIVSLALDALKQEIRTDSEFAALPLLDRLRYRETYNISSLGGFAVPDLIRSITEHNGVEEFCLFLRASLNSEDYTAYYESEGTLWPSLEEKLTYIREWWEQERPRYIEVSDMCSEIDRAIEELVPE
jgi:hypothetical protein